jgi:hypothetical protein
MRLYVGRVTARCMACGCDDWHLKDAAAKFGMLSEVACAACGTATTYADLALQTPLESGAFHGTKPASSPVG